MTSFVGKRTSSHAGDGFLHEPPSKRLAVGAGSSTDLFGGLGRDAYMLQRVHRKLHPQAATLSDHDLHELGRRSFNEQFPMLGADNKQVHTEQRLQTDLFGGMGRDAYMQQRVHRKLHAQVSILDDEELFELGKCSFNEQFPMIEQAAAQLPNQQPNNFGGLGRDGYMQQHVHKKLHVQAAALSDEDLLKLGKLSFNEQFPFLEQTASGEQDFGQQEVDLFGGLGRDAYMHQRVHRRLHPQAASLSDHELSELGRRSFNEQFPMLEQPAVQPLHAEQQQTDMFGGLGRDAYMQQRVHRKLHAQAVALSDQELWELGNMSFNDQFPYFGENHAAPKQGHDMQQYQGEIFGDQGRDAYMQQRVHRKLHPQAAALSDKELLDLGKLSFNEQFPYFGEQQQQIDIFGGLGRDMYMQQRVHRKLHAQAAALGDKDLLELGKLSFNEQFPFLESAIAQRQQVKQRVQMFKGLDRDAYLQQHVHRRLHAQAATLSDHDLLELGRRSFNEQFPMLEQSAREQPPQADVFGGQGRDAYMQQRVHRKLHSQATTLSDEELLELGKLSFNDQFPMVEQLKEIGVDQQQHHDLFGGMGRDGYMRSRIHRRLHVQAAQLSDTELFELGKLSFNAQFPVIEGKSSDGELAA